MEKQEMKKEEMQFIIDTAAKILKICYDSLSQINEIRKDRSISDELKMRQISKILLEYATKVEGSMI